MWINFIYMIQKIFQTNPQFRLDHKIVCFNATKLKIKTTKQGNIELVSSFIPLMYVREHVAKLININEFINYIIQNTPEREESSLSAKQKLYLQLCHECIQISDENFLVLGFRCFFARKLAFVIYIRLLFKQTFFKSFFYVY